MSLNVAKCHSNYVILCKWERNRKTLIQLLISVLILLVTKIMITWQTFRDMRDVLLLEEQMIFSHRNIKYKEKRARLRKDKFNGAFYYSKEIVENIIPNVDTDRNWITVNIPGNGWDHSIMFVHNNLHPENYNWMSRFKDLVLVCGVEETRDKVKHLGKTIYLPLSIDVEAVSQFARDKDKDVCFAGRENKRLRGNVPADVEYLEGLPRKMFLSELARYEKAYAVGRCALEAKALGCEILPYDDRYPDPDVWQVIDNKEAVKILQKELDRIDGKAKEETKEETQAEPEDISKMTKAELIALAEEKNISINKRAKKAEIVEQINAGR